MAVPSPLLRCVPPTDAAWRIFAPAQADRSRRGRTSRRGLLAGHATGQQQDAAHPCHRLEVDHHPAQGLAAAGEGGCLSAPDVIAAVAAFASPAAAAAAYGERQARERPLPRSRGGSLRPAGGDPADGTSGPAARSTSAFRGRPGTTCPATAAWCRPSYALASPGGRLLISRHPSLDCGASGSGAVSKSAATRSRSGPAPRRRLPRETPARRCLSASATPSNGRFIVLGGSANSTTRDNGTLPVGSRVGNVFTAGPYSATQTADSMGSGADAMVG